MLSKTHRSISLAVTALLALAGASLALAFTGGHGAHAHGTAHQARKGPVSAQELALRNEMRRLWEDHITWTRLAIISLTTGSADTDATVGRLLRNQTDIGNAVKPFYGRPAGNALTRLLREHITIAAELVAAAKAGNQAAVADAQRRWQANADAIATFLARANPRQWKRAAIRAMMRDHLRLTTQEALARLAGDWAADVVAYDRIHRQALHMADMLSTGIVAQFPGRFR